MNSESKLPNDRFLHTLDVVFREGRHLAYSRNRVYAQPINAEWVEGLEDHPELVEMLEAFVSRFGRMQDTMADKLIPRWLMALAENPGSQIENLNRAERLGIVESVEDWLEARKLRNRLVHEYMEDPQAFAESLRLAEGYSGMLFITYGRIRTFAVSRMNLDESRLPPQLP